MGSSTSAAIADLAAVTATTIAAIGSLPQLRRVIVLRDARGVSLASAAIGIGTELAWLAYTVSGGLWSAVPEALMMAASNTVLAVALVHRGAITGPALRAGAIWFVAVCATAAFGGRAYLGVLLAAAYALQVTPAVWTAWHTDGPSGVASATWLLTGVEGALWLVYGLHHGEGPVIYFAVVAMVASALILLRKSQAAPGAARIAFEAGAARGSTRRG